MAYMICKVVSQQTGKTVRTLSDLSKFPLLIYNTEASGALHRSLYKALGSRLFYSEYFGPQYQSGELVGSIRHEDLCALSYPENSFDIVLTSDVLEHVYDPYLALKNIYNVLKVGGVHIFTVPFHQTEYVDEVVAIPDEHHRPQFLGEPIYHLDPIHPEGAPVFTIFSLELLIKLWYIGFRTQMWLLYAPMYGILGSNALVFVSEKVGR
jgi:SAM-dependent methyltransferase